MSASDDHHLGNTVPSLSGTDDSPRERVVGPTEKERKSIQQDVLGALRTGCPESLLAARVAWRSGVTLEQLKTLGGLPESRI